MSKKQKEHYIDNKLFFQEMKIWKDGVNAANAAGTKHPPVTEYIGTCFMSIAEGLSRKPNFMNYHYRDEMISDGIENCVLYAYNFNPDKSSNPFSYFTQIIYYAFLRRISKEKKQVFIKLKLIENSDEDSHTKRWYRQNYLGDGMTKPAIISETDIKNFENSKTGDKETPKKKIKISKKKK